ncbi:MAG: histidinol-phosphatase HisJ family protein [Oscillospiraceae bacterium]|jgi:histidinol-phosphatase (PHP family)|nr:histidinol-phosphatase HisJ family protein [Oscillospiraceae bacterium]
MLCDYHTHTVHSMDGRQTLDELCQAAIRIGLDEVCITDHYEPHHYAPLADIPPTIELARQHALAIQTYPALSIKLGIEVGDYPEYHDEIVRWLADWDLDYMLLSLHLVDGLDPYDPLYFEKYAFSRAKSYRAYAHAVLKSINSWNPSEFDALAHLGYVARYAPPTLATSAPAPAVNIFKWNDAPDIIDAILTTLAQNGKALEINTSSYRTTGEPTPGSDILKRFRELGGEFIMFGSDAHIPAHIGFEFARAHAMARALGFRHTLRFNKRTAIPIAIPQ